MMQYNNYLLNQNTASYMSVPQASRDYLVPQLIGAGVGLGVGVYQHWDELQNWDNLTPEEQFALIAELGAETVMGAIGGGCWWKLG